MKKRLREKGKIRLSRMFQELKQGERVAVKRELAERAGFPEKIQGKTGMIEGRKGKAYIVKIAVGKGSKKFIIKPVHLKKLK